MTIVRKTEEELRSPSTCSWGTEVGSKRSCRAAEQELLSLTVINTVLGKSLRLFILHFIGLAFCTGRSLK